jgi:acyl-CoA reductase-like NAD-dependent aldehyde dehydrogenase
VIIVSLISTLQLLEQRGEEVRKIIEEEINCSKLWSHINLQDSLGLIDEAAALVASDALSGTIPITRDSNAPTLVFKEPMGVILGIAPWNAPLILGFRAVVAPIAAGNTAILKVMVSIFVKFSR